MTDKIYGLLGLCQRAGKCKSGEFAVEKSIKSGKSFLVIIPEDASDNTKKKFRNMTTYRSVPYQELGTKETLGHQLGRSERSSISLSLIHISEPTRRVDGSRMPSSA